MASQENEPSQVVVWDPFVRIFHWLLALAFVVAYVTEGENMDLHAPAGYTIGVLIILRVIWGFIGSKYARFRDFIYGPKAILGYLAGLVTLRGDRHLGHSPAGGAMIIILLISLSITVIAGLIVYGAEDNAGPLGGLFPAASEETVSPGAAPQALEEEEEHGGGRHEESPMVEFFEEVHEVFANLTLILVIIHVAAVFWVSLIHRENLARAMVTGRKRR